MMCTTIEILNVRKTEGEGESLARENNVKKLK